MSSELNGQVAVVTGSGRGIGRAIAVSYARAGARVLLAARSEAEIEAVAQEIRAAGGQAEAVVTDVSQAADVAHMVDMAMQRWGHIDILVNNAGVGGPQGLIHELDLAEVDQTWAVNIRGVFLGCQAVVPHMMAQKGGNIINVSSGAGQPKPRTRVRSLPYQISKFAVEGLTNALSVQLRPFEINVNSFVPGVIRTSLHDRTPSGVLIALGGKMGEPEDVEAGALFLATRKPGQFTGQIVHARDYQKA